jgi:hypothetical protein
VEIRARNGYYDVTRAEREAVARMIASGNPAVAATDVLPRSDIPLDVAVSPFALPEGRAALAVVLRVRPSGGRTTETVDVRAALYHPERGNEVSAQSHRLTLDWSPGAAPREYEVLSRLAAGAGRYELRVGLLAGDGRTASVYATVQVPAFDAQNLSLSGLVLAAEPSGLAQPRDAVADVLPIRPTARRSFRPTDAVTAFVRVYQKNPTFAPAAITARITDAKGVVLGQDSQTIGGRPAAPGSAGDFRTDLPLESLPAGEYLLTIHAAAGGHSAERALRFLVESTSP